MSLTAVIGGATKRSVIG